MPLFVCVLVPVHVFGACLVLSWTASGDDHRSGRASHYDLRYSRSYITDANWDTATPVSDMPYPHPAGSLEFVRVSNLDPGVTYYFALKVGDEVPNWSPMSNVVARTTPLDCIGVVGNVDCDPDEKVTLSDLAVLIDCLYISGEPPCCPTEAHVAGNFDQSVSLVDLTLMIRYLFAVDYDLPPCP